MESPVFGVAANCDRSRKLAKNDATAE